MEQLSLVIFSVCIQAAVGIMLFVGIARAQNKDGIFKNATVVAAALGIIGALASLAHLGQPLGALKALNQFGSSWLSKEIWFTALFVGLTVLATLLIFIKPENKAAITGLTWVAIVIGLIDVYSMAAIYSTTSVPIWQNNVTFVEFYAATISIGAVLFLLLSLKEAISMGRIVALAVVGIVIIQVAAVVPYFATAGSSSSAALQKSLEIMAGMGLANSLKWIGILAGAAMLSWIVKGEEASTYGSLLAGSAILLLVGHVMGRYLFYATVVVTGIGLS